MQYKEGVKLQRLKETKFYSNTSCKSHETLQLGNSEALKSTKMNNNYTYRKLIVWQKSMELVTLIYKEVKVFPADELYALTSQIKRSATSIPSNIAEGYGREEKKDYLRFLNIALSSLFELQTQIEIAFNLAFIKEDNFNALYDSTREIERMLTSFIRKIKA